MIEILIKEHIEKLTTFDIDRFAKENNIFLNSEELDNVYDIVKRNWKELVYGDSNGVFESNRSKVDSNNYDKIKDLFDLFKKKYQRFL